MLIHVSVLVLFGLDWFESLLLITGGYAPALVDAESLLPVSGEVAVPTASAAFELSLIHI